MSQEAESALSGTIWPIPLTVEDRNTHDIIKSTTIYLHVARSQISNDDPNFTNISITGVYQDGSFHTDITAELSQSIFRGGRVPKKEWTSVLAGLFPIDEEDRDSEISQRLQVEARLMALQSQYDPLTGDLLESDDDPNSGALAVSIKTTDKLPLTVGSFDLAAVELDEHQGNLFNWLDLIHGQRTAMSSEIELLKKRISTLEQENFAVRANYETSAKSHRMIVDDLEQKFYQLLDSKKETIWSLT
ncbi:uncharacterized protein CANTADRAFT_45306, partial [Suhomyces tanzawaensis NRRL Y-17324]